MRRCSPHRTTRRGYCEDLLTVWAPLAREVGHDRFFVGCLTTAHLQMWRTRGTGQAARPLTPRSIARDVKTLSSLHVYAAGVLDPPPPNPVSEAVRPVIDEEGPSTASPILEETELAAVFAAARTAASSAGPPAASGDASEPRAGLSSRAATGRRRGYHHSGECAPSCGSGMSGMSSRWALPSSSSSTPTN
ncbi:hypothetical protein ACLQ2P_07180 [Actinomadura citrea]|uniref:hypothetical protein n=1 Tax=Actinomadura citrea TaxID=46158 RepID=UPI003CE51746